MASKGYSTYKIATELNNSGIKTKSNSQWHPLTVKRIITNPSYTGKTLFGQTKRIGTKTIPQPKECWTTLTEVTPAIITDELFKQTLSSISNHKLSRPLNLKTSYLLTGFVKCPKCGSPIVGTILGKKYRYYRCRGTVPTTTRDVICHSGYIKADDIESFVWDKITNRYTDSLSTYITLKKMTDYLSGNDPNVLNNQISQLKSKLKSYKQKEKNLYELLSNDSVTKDFVLEAITKLKSNKIEDENQLKSLMNLSNKSMYEFTGAFKGTNYINDLKDKISNATDLSQKREILEFLEAKITAIPNDYKFTCFLDEFTINESTGTISYDFKKEVPPGLCLTELIKDCQNNNRLTYKDLLPNCQNKATLTTEQTSA
jgi:site-specific DNA recombinase